MSAIRRLWACMDRRAYRVGGGELRLGVGQRRRLGVRGDEGEGERGLEVRLVEAREGAAAVPRLEVRPDDPVHTRGGARGMSSDGLVL